MRNNEALGYDLAGKWNISQNKSEDDRAGVAEGLLAQGDAALSRLGQRR
ncbi:hypothetical protein [Nereida sp. MMG025]|nr:hypothetical protein [Nereida sp. MMG025]MCF6445152.1 hypothetical protein [Nereida sp. MMG025]